MVYNAYSYRRWLTVFPQTIKYLLAERRGLRAPAGGVTERQRGAYDTSTRGRAPPHTDFVSKSSLSHFLREFSATEMWLENAEEIFHRVPVLRHKLNRAALLRSKLTDFAGLDIYAVAKK